MGFRLGGVRIVAAGKVVPPRGWVCPRRSLSENVLLYVRKGRGDLTAAEQVLPMRGAHLYLVRAGVPHILAAEPGQILEHWHLHFALLDASGQPVAPEAGMLPEALSLPVRSAIEREFLRCVQCASEQGTASGAGALASFFTVLEHVFQAAAGAVGGDGAAPARNGDAHARRAGQVMDAVELMMRHVSDDLSLEEISAHVGMSPSHFEKVFKRVTGSTPHAYYLGLKMERAKALLAAPNRRLGDIANELGFSSLHHFSRTFKQYEGELPSRYAARIHLTAPRPSSTST